MNQKAPIKDSINSIECISSERNKKLKQQINNRRRQIAKKKERMNFFLE
jgi:hypothetical protein